MSRCPRTTPAVAEPSSRFATCAGLSPGSAPSSSAAAPATCGAAIEVPDSSSVAVSPVYQSETMSTPGAKRSTHDPRLENDARRSSRSLAATVSAAGSRAGEESQASSSSLPAATATVTPSSIKPRIAASTFSPAGPLRLRFATAGVPLRWSRAAQSMPAITPEVSPPPSQSRVRTATSETAGATPYSVPPIVPATCVPCPAQSRVPRPSSIALKPDRTRPPRSRWPSAMPESIT